MRFIPTLGEKQLQFADYQTLIIGGSSAVQRNNIFKGSGSKA